jgi:hypothetical protein
MFKKTKNNNVLVDIFRFLINKKAWWLAPIIILLLLVGFLMIISHESAISPFIYTIF